MLIYLLLFIYRTPDMSGWRECRAGPNRGVSMEGCCGSGFGAGRSFLTKAEKIEMLEEYRESLESEAKGVAERIAELKKHN